MIPIAQGVWIDERDIELQFVRAAGPGGQNVNKVATAVQLRYDIAAAAGLPDDVRTRLLALAGSRATKDGVLIIEARRFRTQERNRQDAMERLVDLVRRATLRPRKRLPTRTPPAARRARLQDKKRRSQTKQRRRSALPDDS